MLGWTDRMSETHTFHVSKSICLLSHYSFGETFERWLTFLQVSKAALVVSASAIGSANRYRGVVHLLVLIRNLFVWFIPPGGGCDAPMMTSVIRLNSVPLIILCVCV